MTIFYLDYENGNDSNNGSTWALAWKTITNGATAARIAPGDVVRIAKSPAPSSIGNATWTNQSKTVTLATAQNLNIDLCEAAWTGAGDTTVALTGVATDAKQGSYCMKLTLDSSPQVSTKQAYHATGTLNLSAYQKISFWIKNSSTIVENNWKVCLCSDTGGATPVDTFYVPAIPSSSHWVPLTLTKSGGGNLGSSIQSIAIYTNSVAPTASSNILVDDFVSCTTSGLNIQSVISKNSSEQGGSETWYGLQSINGTTLLLDNEVDCKANVGRGYSTKGTTPQTITTYKRETIKTTMVSSMTTDIQTISDSGSVAGGNIQFLGGWNTSTTTMDGETFFDALNGCGYGIRANGKSYITFDHIGFFRCDVGLFLYSSANYIVVNNLPAGNNCSEYGLSLYNSTKNSITSCFVCNNKNYGLYVQGSSQNKITNLTALNNFSYGISFYSSGFENEIFNAYIFNSGVNAIWYYDSFRNKIYYLSTTGNVAVINYSVSDFNYVLKSDMVETAELSSVTAYSNARLFFKNRNSTGYDRIFTDGGQIESLATDRSGGTGKMWKLTTYSSTRGINYPLNLSIAKIAVAANNLVTVSAYMKKDNATTVDGKLVCRGGQIAGVSSDVSATKANDTNWENLTITFTPTESGVVEIEAWACYLSGNSNVYVEDMTITQA